MNTPNPALVSERDARPLPRAALLIFCAAYVLPGVFGRDPWKSADITAFGYMLGIARDPSTWLAPTVGGLPADAALLPYWLGALFVRLFGTALGVDLAARIPFALLLVATMVLTWYSSYHLARSDAAQPLPLAFGGEARPADYARAIADGALLALIASLGLLQLGHETTPELAQLASVALFVYSLAASPMRRGRPRIAALVALPALAASGAPAIAMALCAVGIGICLRGAPQSRVRHFLPWLLAAGALSVLAAVLLDAWAWRIAFPASIHRTGWELLRLLLWFTWPAWPLAVWTLWRWRLHWAECHIAIPLGGAAVSLVACVAMGGSDRALMLALPPLALLAAFALPTLQRATAAAIDWFSVSFFTLFAAAIWVVYASMQTGVPAQPAANVARLAPGYANVFSFATLVAAAAASAAWLWLVNWRTGPSRHPLWKSLVLPAAGVALCWLLAMTLLLPPLDHARSYRSLVERIALRVPRGSCVAAPGMPRAQVVALEYLGGYVVDAVTPVESQRCRYLVRLEPRSAAPPAPSVGPGWELLSQERRNTSDDETTAIYRRRAGAVSR
jgi:hypothetical protein